MKVRTDFVTNSSSSSFILVFNNREEMRNSMKKVGEQYGANVEEVLTGDVIKGKVDRRKAEGLLRNYYRREAKYRFIYGTKDWIKLSTEEFYAKHNTVNEKMGEYVKKSVADTMAKLPKRGYISVVEYSDNNGLFFSEMEHYIVPKLPFTVLSMSHH